MARALIVGCGGRGRALGTRLLAEGWAVRGTSRSGQGLGAIEAAGIEPALADPDRVGTVVELVGDVGIAVLLLGSAEGDPEALAELHGSRLERLMEHLVDTPVRGVVYEAAGTVDPALLESGSEIVRTASSTWRIPIELVDADPADQDAWLGAMESAVTGLLAGRS